MGTASSAHNPILWNKFEKGMMKEVIRGKNNEFIPETTYRDCHDRLLVVREAMKWAISNGHEETFRETILDIIRELANEKECNELFDTLLCINIATRDLNTGKPLFDHSQLKSMTKEAERTCATALTQDTGLRNIAIEIWRHLNT